MLFTTHSLTGGGRAFRSAAFACTLLGLGTLQGCHAQEPWPLWESYTKHFVDAQGRVVDRSAHDRTTSEGQAYAMFFALVDNDRAHFDLLLKWTEANLAGGDLTERLPAWDWGRSDNGEWKILDNNSASDADLWIAYTLLQAGRLWHDPGLSKLGEAVAARIAREEVVLVPSFGTVLLPGPHGFQVEDRYILNPSYLPLPLLAYFEKAQPQGPWSGVAESLPLILDAELDHGFAMDWVTAGPGGIHPVGPPVEPSAGSREPQPSGSYDAIRVYLWTGMTDEKTSGARDLLRQLSGMGAYLHTHPIPPLEVDPAGNILHAESPVGFSAAVVPFLKASGASAEARTQLNRMAATLDPASGLYGRAQEYYDQNLALFSTGWTDERFRFERDGKLDVKWK